MQNLINMDLKKRQICQLLMPQFTVYSSYSLSFIFSETMIVFEWRGMLQYVPHHLDDLGRSS
jgi:hypothetical protein